ncbi:MAG: MogA/MoaB family molybdenum cofactor biosynthesis protein [Tissierellia bacterium]|nr:MogA/MoaB family molybdenum cofactor biosynthesis protein [Tissierellia bacterium]
MFRVRILTMSDSSYFENAKDFTTEAIVKMLPEEQYEVIGTEILPDDEERIANRLLEICDKENVDLVLTTGGTGFAPRDHTPEATAKVIERQTWGISYRMMEYSLKKTEKAMMSRGISGIRKNTLIINLPGSPKGATENLESVIGVLDHGLKLLREEAADCANMKEKRH